MQRFNYFQLNCSDHHAISAGVLQLFHNRRARLFAAVLFSVGQLFLAAHAAEFGTAPHGHDELACQFMLSEDNDNFVSSNAPDVGNLPSAEALVPPRDLGTARAPTRAIRPPQTGPPGTP